MKRMYYLMAIGVVGAILVAPLGMLVTGNGLSLGVTAAHAAAVTQDFLPDTSCIPIALPVMPGAPGTCDAGGGAAGISNDPATGGAIVNYLRGWLALLSYSVGLVVMLMLVIGGVQYITSAADPGMVKSAKKRITNAITALVLYLMMFAILQFLVPGGIL
ncbi:MAG TPA: hypothetical protein VMS08_02955 [Candidatus Saccharimonadia bacterium]|nr:hypothetical protein [Candidatus Saccharimonadia bacterium]